MKTTDRIFAMVSEATEPMTLKQLQDGLELKPGIVSGSLTSLCKSGKLPRKGRAHQWKWAKTTMGIQLQKGDKRGRIIGGIVRLLLTPTLQASSPPVKSWGAFLLRRKPCTEKNP